jgi:O-antigen ligase
MRSEPQTAHGGPADGGLAIALLAVVWLAALPLGSKRLWPLALLVLTVFALCLWTAWLWRHHHALAMQRLRLVRWPLGLLLGLAAWMALQGTPLPGAVVRFLSPEAWAVQQGVTPIFTLSLDPHRTRTQAAFGLALALYFAMVVLTLRARQRIDQAVMGLVAIGLFQALLGLFLWSTQARYTLLHFEVTHEMVKGTFGNRNHLAGFLMLVLSMGIGLMVARLGSQPMLRASHWRGRLASALAFVLSAKMRLRLMLVILVIALVLTRSRMGNSAFFAALLIAGAITLLLTRRSAPAMLTLIASLVVIDIAVVGTWVGLEQVLQRVQNTELLIEQGGSQESVEQRQMAARYAINLVKDFPLSGTGAGSFYGAFIRYQPPGNAFFDHAHNDYVELLADWGLVGCVLAGALVLQSAARFMRTLLKRRSSMARGMSFGALMGTVGMGIHATVDFNLSIPVNALLMVLVLAVGWSAATLPSRAGDRRSVD